MSLRDEFPEDAVFRVTVEGAQLTGMVPSGPHAHKGWSKPLTVGEEITCKGVQRGWGSDPGFEVRFHCDEPGVSFVTFWPAQFLAMASRPAPGALERVR